MEPFRIHLFVCTQQKPEGVTSCSASGSFAVLETLDKEIHGRGLDREAQLTSCGCMGLCDEGPVMVVYPEGIWYRHVRPDDVLEIVSSHLSGGKPVERLVWNDAPAMQAMAIEHGEKYRVAVAARDKAGTLPDSLDQVIRGYMPSRCLLTALELDIFSAVGDGATASEVARTIGANPRAAAMLLNALASLGLLLKVNDQYQNAPMSARFFAKGSKDSQRDGLLHIANIWHRWSTLTDAVRAGTRVPTPHDGNSQWTENFIAAMQRNSKDRAPLLVKHLETTALRRILDLGGGSGIYSIAFAKAFPSVRCDILDLPEITPLTADYVNKAGMSRQITVHAGNMLEDDLGSNYDLVMLNAICHMFSEEQNLALFRRIRQTLTPKGRLVVQDFILNPDNAGPQQAALFSLNMLVSTESGATYSESEYMGWMKSAGFAEVSRINLPGPSSLIVGTV